MRGILIPIAVALSVTATACGGGNEPADQGGGASSPAEAGLELTPDCVDARGQETVEVELTHELTIVPDCLIVTTDQRFHIRNTDFQRRHTLTISEKEYHRTPFLFDSGEIASEEELTAGPIGDAAPGIYPLFCKLHLPQKGVVQISS